MALEELFEESATVVSLRVCEDLQLLKKTTVSVYIGPSGIFAVAPTAEDPEKLYLALRETLGTTKLRLYISDSGLYDPLRGVMGQVYDEEILGETIEDWTCAGYTLWHQTKIDDFARRLYHADSLCRGRYIDEDGTVYILHGDAFLPASQRSSDVMFYLTLFGGVLGLHRFYSGKYITGMLYLCTGGLFGFGWLLDLLSLFFGVAKDRSKRYYEPLRNLPKKLLLVPLGVPVGVLLFCVYLDFFTSFLSALNLSLTGSL